MFISSHCLKSQRLLFCIISLLFIGLSLTVLSRRNLYEDELYSFRYINMRIAEIWGLPTEVRLHPPGMYILSHSFYSLIPSERWVTLGPLLFLFAGLSLFAYRSLRSFAGASGPWLVFLLGSFLHPHIIIWSNSIRWYPYWTGLALITLTLGLGVGQGECAPWARYTPIPSLEKSLAIGLLLAIMFYVNYLTPLFVCAFIGAWLARYPFARQSMVRLLSLLVVFALVSVPQYLPFASAVMNRAAEQRGTLLFSSARLVHGVFLGEALLPWHPIVPVFLLFVAAPCLLLVLRTFVRFVMSYPRGILFWPSPLWVSILVFFGCFFCLGALSGLGRKPRSFLVLAPIMGFLVSTGMLHVRRRCLVVLMSTVTMMWSVSGAYNMVTRQGTAKAGINDRPEEVLKLVARKAKGKTAIVFTADPGVTYVLNRAAHRANRNWHVCSSRWDYIHDIPSCKIPSSYDPQVAFVVESYVAKSGERNKLNTAARAAVETIRRPSVAVLSKDRDVVLKRKIPGLREVAKHLPDYRFRVFYGEPKAGVNWSAIAEGFRISR